MPTDASRPPRFAAPLLEAPVFAGDAPCVDHPLRFAVAAAGTTRWS